MSRWSDLMKLSKFEDYSEYLDWPGCYEIGFARDDYFSPKYVGKAQNLLKRLKSHMSETRCHNDFIAEKLLAEKRHNLWFRVLRTVHHYGLEARMQDRRGIGESALYNWNKRGRTLPLIFIDALGRRLRTIPQ